MGRLRTIFCSTRTEKGLSASSSSASSTAMSRCEKAEQKAQSSPPPAPVCHDARAATVASHIRETDSGANAMDDRAPVERGCGWRASPP